MEDRANIAALVLSSSDLAGDIQLFTRTLGFRMDTIYPSDDPAIAMLSGWGLHLRLDRFSAAPASDLRLTGIDPAELGVANKIITPGGTRIELLTIYDEFDFPAIEPAFQVGKLTDENPWVIGRAGMHYRDLIPERLGGGMIASHIRIPDGGPVPDTVHYHTVGFQLIYCYQGWVRLVYEDQGPPFILNAGECVTQPPGIRHRVLESSDNLEVVEIALPATHMTTLDHELELPTGKTLPQRHFGGQTFCHFQSGDTQWLPGWSQGLVYCDTGVAGHSKDAAGLLILKVDDGVDAARLVKPGGVHFQAKETDELVFLFVLTGNGELSVVTDRDIPLSAGDAVVLPPDMQASICNSANQLSLLYFTVPLH